MALLSRPPLFKVAPGLRNGPAQWSRELRFPLASLQGGATHLLGRERQAARQTRLWTLEEERPLERRRHARSYAKPRGIRSCLISLAEANMKLDRLSHHGEQGA